MAINTYLSTTESKKQTKQTRKTEQNHEYGECFDGCQMGGACGGMGEEVRELRSTNRQLQNSHGDIKYSIGNGVAYGHEQCWGALPKGVGSDEWKGGKIRTTV